MKATVILLQIIAVAVSIPLKLILAVLQIIAVAVVAVVMLLEIMEVLGGPLGTMEAAVAVVTRFEMMEVLGGPLGTMGAVVVAVTRFEIMAAVVLLLPLEAILVLLQRIPTVALLGELLGKTAVVAGPTAAMVETTVVKLSAGRRAGGGQGGLCGGRRFRRRGEVMPKMMTMRWTKGTKVPGGPIVMPLERRPALDLMPGQTLLREEILRRPTLLTRRVVAVVGVWVVVAVVVVVVVWMWRIRRGGRNWRGRRVWMRARKHFFWGFFAKRPMKRRYRRSRLYIRRYCVPQYVL